jgi:hypothetical protein
VKRTLSIALLGITALVSGCAGQNKYEREADTITRAVMADDAATVQKQFAPGIPITRVRVASYSDELEAQGKLLSIKEESSCTPGYHCVLVKFEKNSYLERLQLNDHNQVTYWTFHMIQPSSAT